MPYSCAEGKLWVAEQLAELRPASILDVGAGAGTYARVIRHLLPGAHLTAIEAWEPYVNRFELASLYSCVIVGDARVTELPEVDAVILGDVLEHMPVADAVALWDRSRESAAMAAIASLPIVPWPQGEVDGNPHEAHVVTWTHDRAMSSLSGVSAHRRGSSIGVYLAPGLRGGAGLRR